jgi:hypothetical protein
MLYRERELSAVHGDRFDGPVLLEDTLFNRTC